MGDISVSDEWHRLMRLPKGWVLLTCARDVNKRIELQLIATQLDWVRYQRLDKEYGINTEWFEQKALSADLTVSEILDLFEAEQKELAEHRAKVSPCPDKTKA